ncbi:DNA methyltransferase [Endozoicomonas montiporae]|uniref:DNA methyltransferase n=2 Tax=Endozoicomonas montiporae TaxID=1027273 RepID=A0A081NBL1_9GAMM|nr:DNA methyltransferase [Endozoicomonas montiporae]AMO56127.1 adenine-specific DNA-methyltransferase [Endozoicomonas montiporae CL-33]KEQ15834.1 DNA methyltransferase [Endozoicomonas montiporae]
MSRLTDLIAQAKAKDPQMGADLEREFKALSSRRAFGLNFERHRPETVELPQRPVRKGDKVRVLPERGTVKKGDQRLWQVKKIIKDNGQRFAQIELMGHAEPETDNIAVDDLVVVAEFRDHILPGLVSTGKVERGGDKPCHTVINGENYHALKALTYTHWGKIDIIYIDPPYNTGAKDWKYNNDYVEGDDLYRHSKWLAFMERRLKLAAQLLNPQNSTLIVSIDEKEYLRLGLLLEQVFPEGRVQMVSSVINPKGATRQSSFGRTDEYLFFVSQGNAAPTPVPLPSEWKVVQDKRAAKLRWAELLRSGSNTQREDSPNQFYPIFVHQLECGPAFHSVGEAYFGDDWRSMTVPEGCFAIWPIRSDGTEGNWQNSAESLRVLIEKGFAKLGRWREDKTAVTYLKRGEQTKVEGGVFPVIGRRIDNSVIVDDAAYQPTFIPGTQWRIASHNAEQGGTNLQKSFIPGRKFPFPKSLYAVEDAVRFFVSNKPNATILDFFSGSGTTAHAIMRLNRQDGGQRQCISITNNEVAADEHKKLREQGLRPGDADWEQWGICDYITKPRVKAAITGQTPDGEPIKGDYKFTDEFPMADGFEENAEFFTLTYETPVAIRHNLAFERIAPLLWMRAGSQGQRIEQPSEKGWDVADTYGLLTDLDQATAFCNAVKQVQKLRIAYIVTNDDRRFQSIARRLPEAVEPVRLYESYLKNFQFAIGE